MDLLIPPQRCRTRPGRFRWTDHVVLASPSEADVLPITQLAHDLNRYAHIRSRIERNAFGPADVRIRRGAAAPAGSKEAQSYRMTVSPQGIEIVAGGDAGAYYAIQTLREMLSVHDRSLGACTIDDEPDFVRRGIYHDCSRGKVPTVATLKALVERLARWKINELQFYIENVFTFRRHPAIGRGYCPFTPLDMLELQEHCKQHHVRLVGSLSSFGHMERTLILPQYRHLAEMPGYSGWPGGCTLCPTDRRSIKFVAELWEEYVPLFEAVDFNACCDETWELGQGRSKKLAQRVGVGRVYLDFLLALHRLCLRHGKRLNIWADIVLDHPELLGELPRDIVMLNWDYNYDGPRIPRTRQIAAAGLPIVVCPGTSSWQTHGTRLENAIGNVSRFAAEGRRYCAEGLLNTDWGDLGHRNFLGVSLHGFAHGAAHAWNGRAVNDKAFTGTFCFHAFGRRDDKMARAVAVLGSTYATCGAPSSNFSGLYHALVEPLRGPAEDKRDWIGAMSPKALRDILGQLQHFSSQMPDTSAMEPFERLAIEEYELAARMDCLACRRSLGGKDIRSGTQVPAKTLRVLAADMKELSRDFTRLWMSRNRISRIRNNLRLFERARREAIHCARR